MFSFFNSRNSTLVNATTAPGTALNLNDSLAHQLMERADASAGRDPHRAQELRDAALAFLSVVR